MKNEQLQKERKRHPNPKRKIDGILFDIEDLETRLLGSAQVSSAGWDPKADTLIDCLQLWRTKDGHYFLYDGADLKHIDVETAHGLMNDDQNPGYRRFVRTYKQKRELELDDDRRQKQR